MRKIAIVSINEPGFDSALKLDSILAKKMSDSDIHIFHKSERRDKNANISSSTVYHNIDELLQDHWDKFDIFICFLATGIVVRKIAPYLKSKTSDPAILVMSLDLKQILPLLSGHIGGANDFAQELVNLIPNAVSFITTATDQTKTFAFDLFAKKSHFDILNIEALATISNALINGEKISVLSYESIFEAIKKYSSNSQNLFELYLLSEQGVVDNLSMTSVVISPFGVSTPHYSDKPNTILTIKIKPIYIGIGLNRNTSAAILGKSLSQFLIEHHLNINDVAGLASFSAKADEKGLQDLAWQLNLPLSFFNEQEINTITENLSPSRAEDYFNIKGVAEPSAILASKYKSCFLKKHSYYQAVTLAAAF